MRAVGTSEPVAMGHVPSWAILLSRGVPYWCIRMRNFCAPPSPPHFSLPSWLSACFLTFDLSLYIRCFWSFFFVFAQGWTFPPGWRGQMNIGQFSTYCQTHKHIPCCALHLVGNSDPCEHIRWKCPNVIQIVGAAQVKGRGTHQIALTKSLKFPGATCWRMNQN